MVKFITAKQAAELIPDGAIVGVAGMGLSGWAEEIACAIRDRYKETGHPCGLHLKQNSAMGDWVTEITSSDGTAASVPTALIQSMATAEPPVWAKPAPVW